MIVSVLGLGYIGLPTASILAKNGVNVIGIDVNSKIVDSTNEGKSHFFEPELDNLIENVVKKGNLRASKRPEKADAFLITVSTPLRKNKTPDLSNIAAASKSIAPILEKGNLVILESTSPVGTTEKMVKWISDERPDLKFPNISKRKTKTSNEELESDIAIAYCPERVLPGDIVRELVENDRIIGGLSINCAKKATELYKIFVKGDFFLTDSRTAELCKLVENSFRDVNIAFANEISIICDKLKINVWDLIKLANRHPRVEILKPGPGVGGHCIAVDPWFIIDSVPNEAKLIKKARLVNNKKTEFVLEKIEHAVNITNKEKNKLTITCLGITFKPNIDDLRESPALLIARQIGKMGFNKQFIVEPNISELPEGFDKDLTKLTSLNGAIKAANIVVLLVNHYEFEKIDPNLLSSKVVIDTRGSLKI